LNVPTDVAFDSAGITFMKLVVKFLPHCISYLGNLYIADSFNHRIRKVTVSTEIITTIAGTGTSSYSGDNGLATSATLYNPYGVVLDSAGT
jgi:hypothetical protein